MTASIQKNIVLKQNNIVHFFMKIEFPVGTSLLVYNSCIKMLNLNFYMVERSEQ